MIAPRNSDPVTIVPGHHTDAGNPCGGKPAYSVGTWVEVLPRGVDTFGIASQRGRVTDVFLSLDEYRRVHPEGVCGVSRFPAARVHVIARERWRGVRAETISIVPLDCLVRLCRTR